MISPHKNSTILTEYEYDMTLIVVHGRLYIISDATYRHMEESDGMWVYETDTLVLYLNEKFFYHNVWHSNNVIHYEIFDMGNSMQVQDCKYVMKDRMGNTIEFVAMCVNGRAYILSEALCIYIADYYDRSDNEGWWIYKTPTLKIFVDINADDYRYYENMQTRYESIKFTHSDIICTRAKGC